MTRHGVALAASVLLLVPPLLSSEMGAPRGTVPWSNTVTALVHPHHEAHGGTTPLLRTVPITNAMALALDERTQHVFVTCEYCFHRTASAVMLDARTGAILRSVPVGRFPLAAVADVTTNRVFVANQGTNSVSVLDAQSGRVVRTVPVATDAAFLVLATQAGCVVTTGDNNSAVVILDVRTGRVVRTLTLRGGPFRLAVAQRTGRVLVGSTFGHTVTALDARSGTALWTTHIGGTPFAMAVDERSGHIIVASGDVLDGHTGRVLSAAGATNAASILDSNANALVVNTYTQRVFVAAGDAVDVLDLRSGAVLHSTPVATPPVTTPLILPRTGRVLVLLASPVDSDSGAITGPAGVIVLDGHTGAVLRHLVMGHTIQDFGPEGQSAVDTRTKRVFVLDGDGVAVLDASRL